MPKTVQYAAMIGVFIAGIAVARLWSSVFLLALACFLAGALVGAGGLYWYAQGVWRRNPYAFRAIVDRVIAYREQKSERKE